jgi:oxygen-independent coproporphyrinogen-3 oxidase
MKAFNIPQSLLDKYNQPVPRYTSYPPANFFNSQFGERDLFNAISESNVSGTRNLSIYIHIPFCSQKCSYCGCNTHITRDINLIEEYVKALEKEILLISEMVDLSRPVSQIHFGGGSPNYVHINLIDRILSVIKNTFIFIDSPEIAIECHPAELSFQSIDNYVNMGFNRFSLGIQDFNNHILNAINRRIPSINIATLVDHIRNHKGVAVNLDLIYGLPLQTLENFAFTIDSALSVRPDRLVTFSYAHLPQINANQSELEKYQMPTVSAKTELLKYAYNKITSAGYTAIGLDHFALPQDELATALNNKVLHRNFQG